MIISLIGPGDIKFHYNKLINIKNLNKQINEIAKVLADSNADLVLLPDKGISFEIAKKYKELNGKKVFGTVPKNDKDFGITHLKDYINAKINNKKIFDEIINTNTWYKQDVTCCIYGDIIFMLGNSLGCLAELCNGFYLYKLFQGQKKEVQIKKKIHPKIKAGENTPLTAIIYKPFFKEKLPFEIEAYIKKTGGKLYYINNTNELKMILDKLLKKTSKK